MAFAFVSSANGGAASTTSPVSATINSTGANVLFAVVVSDGNNSPAPTALTDSKGNYWSYAASFSQFNARCSLFVSAPTSVGTGHVVTCPAVGTPSLGIAIAAYSYSAGALGGVITGIGSSPVTTLQPGSITPTANNAILINVFAQTNTGTASISGATLRDQSIMTSNHFGCAIADLIQTTAAASNPTWTTTTSAWCACIQIALYDVAGVNRFSAVPLLTLTSNVTSVNNARTSAAPLILSQQQANTPNRASAVPLLYLFSNAPPPIVTDFIIDCPTKNMTITGTNFPTYTRPVVHLTNNGVPVDFTYLYGTSTQIVIHINNFTNGTYSVRVTGS